MGNESAEKGSFFCGLICLGTFATSIAGGILWADKQQQKNRLEALNPEADFPVVGNATIVRIWNRPTINRESCGSYCDLDVCYDDYILEFAWSGTPVSGKFAVQGDQLTTSFDDHCHCPDGMQCPPARYPNNKCFLYTADVGGWRTDSANSTEGQYMETPTFTHNAVSQGFRIMRCTGSCSGKHCGNHRDTCINRMAPRDSCRNMAYYAPITFTETGLKPVGTVVKMRQPTADPKDVSAPYKCPTSAYNPLCLRLGDGPLNEADEAQGEVGDEVTTWTITTAICAPVFLLSLCFLVAATSKLNGDSTPPGGPNPTYNQPAPVAVVSVPVAYAQPSQPVATVTGVELK